MKPSKIMDALDLAWACNEKGLTFVPLFAGEAGLGKSALCKAWVKKKQLENPKFGFIDLRLNYLEPPDMIGRPVEQRIDGILRTVYAIPGMWPTEGEGLLLFEEPNRASSSVMSGLMQVLTEHAVHDHKLPKGWIKAAAINPENSAAYDVNTMDIALKDRFSIFEIEYDHAEFEAFAKKSKWHRNVISFIESGNWIYKKPDELKDGAKYVAPRTFDYLQNAEQAGVEMNPDMHKEVSIAQLGQHIGSMYHKFVFDIRPVTAEDLLKDKKSALERLKKFADPNSYKNDIVSVTVSSVLEAFPEKIDEQTLVDVVMSISADQGCSMLVSGIRKVETYNAENPTKKIETTLVDRIDLDSPKCDQELRKYLKENTAKSSMKTKTAKTKAKAEDKDADKEVK